MTTSHKDETLCSENGTTDDIFGSIRAFNTIIEHGSISSAAQILNWPKSTLSRRLHNLEKQLGHTLMKRSAEGMQLTEAGRRYAQYSQQISHLAHEGQRAVQASMEDVSGKITLGISVDFNWGWISRALNQFLHRFPKISLQVKYSHSPQCLELEEQKVDIWLWSGEEPQTKLRYIPIGSWQRKIYASVSHQAAHLDFNHPFELKKQAWLQLMGTKNDHLFNLASGEIYHLDNLPARLQLENINILADSIQQGYGIGILPTWYARCHIHGKPGTFQAILEQWSAPPIPLALLFPTGPKSQRINLLIEHLKETLPRNWKEYQNIHLA